MEELKLKKILSLVLSLLMVTTINVSAFAAEPVAKDHNTVKQIEVSLADVMDFSSRTGNSYTQQLSKDFATSTGQTGTITSIGQYVDFSRALPKDSKVVSVTMYCPTSVKVTQSKYTAINSFIISNGSNQTTLKFLRTNSPTSECKTTSFAGAPANVKWFIQIQGQILMQHTGMDGFTVLGGSKMIIEYR